MLSLREHHLQKYKEEGKPSIEQGDIIILKYDLSNQAFWRLGIIERLLPGSDEKVRAAIVNVGDNILSVQLNSYVYPVEVKGKFPIHSNPNNCIPSQQIHKAMTPI